MSKVAAVLLTLALAACGMKGPLVMPPGPVPDPLFGKTKPAKPTVKDGADVSTDIQSTNSNSQ
ncbi:MAG: hypothetical protein D3M94_06565 [Rhodocyclales bacterium GT-UBC]|nr:MAG: hypothetical protein D3M94_06565 [Rhodocyclales bacterium GT-UBC]